MNTLNETELMTRAAWLYYQGGLNQEATAKHLGLTRARVNKLLSKARNVGLVSITVNSRDVGQLPLEEAIRQEFQLEYCIVTPPLNISTKDIGESETLKNFPLRAVGSAAASYLHDFLTAKPDAVIGVGWGRTLYQMTLSMAGIHAPNVKFVSMMGSLTANSAFNPFEVVQSFANVTGAEGYFLSAPFIADTPADRNVLLSQRAVAKALELAQKVDLALISVGELTECSILRVQDMISSEDLASLRAAGAVGDTNGVFFDENGKPVKHSLNDRTLASDFKDLKRANTMLLVAGREKVEAVYAFLRNGTAKGVVIDGDSALELHAKITTQKHDVAHCSS